MSSGTRRRLIRSLFKSRLKAVLNQLSLEFYLVKGKAIFLIFIFEIEVIERLALRNWGGQWVNDLDVGSGEEADLSGGRSIGRGAYRLSLIPVFVHLLLQQDYVAFVEWQVPDNEDRKETIEFVNNGFWFSVEFHKVMTLEE